MWAKEHYGLLNDGNKLLHLMLVSFLSFLFFQAVLLLGLGLPHASPESQNKRQTVHNLTASAGRYDFGYQFFILESASGFSM